jgi:hypothetical protein
VELQARHLGKLVELYHRGCVSDMAKVFWGGEKLKGAYYALQAGLYEI